ncbi:MAG: aminotransferase class I/II-fold pyridoxal phosphate-dependent enzyme [Clostridia bacterium]|nr:aminotransferase class I/II-fold pyridoxal phosphate-dependent enzyme [Clostridia bacterium]
MKPLSRTVSPSITMSLDREARALIASGCDVINLTAGQVDLPMPEPGKEAIRRALSENRTGYIAATGSADVKDAVRRRTGRAEGEILLSAGAKPLLSAAVACLCGPGDDVLLPTPCYTSYPEMIRLAGANPVCVFGDPENRFTVSRAALERAATDRTKAILFNNPVNPTGTVYAKDELAEIVGFCRAHDLYLIADEVYGAFVYDVPFVSLYDFPDARERLILVDSASKSFAMAGLRLGWAVAPEPAASAIAGYLSHAVGCPCSLSERAAKAALEDDEAFSLRLREAFRKRRDLLFPLLKDIPGVRTERSDGAFYLWADVRGIEPDDAAFCRALLSEEGVALTPGSAFLCPGYVRIAYTHPEPVLAEAAARLKRFAAQYGKHAG